MITFYVLVQRFRTMKAYAASECRRSTFTYVLSMLCCGLRRPARRSQNKVQALLRSTYHKLITISDSLTSTLFSRQFKSYWCQKDLDVEWISDTISYRMKGLHQTFLPSTVKVGCGRFRKCSLNSSAPTQKKSRRYISLTYRP